MRFATQASLRSSNSFGLDCIADELVEVYDTNQLVDALATDTPVTILGECTNVVLKSRLPGRVVRLRMRKIKITRHADGGYLVVAQAGVNWHELVRFTLGQGISGLENLALIPGSVGAAPFQNIGAYGVELGEICESVRVYNRWTRSFETLAARECGFGYRDSIFKSSNRGHYVICELSLRLGTRTRHLDYVDVAREIVHKHQGSVTSTAIAESVVRIRRRKLPDPRHIGNVGSFFKNPILDPVRFDILRGKLAIQGHGNLQCVKVSAAQLIDEAGWKGVCQGAAQVWPRQPLVIVNLGGATARQVLDLANRIADDIYRRFDIELEREPEVLGVF